MSALSRLATAATVAMTLVAAPSSEAQQPQPRPTDSTTPQGAEVLPKFFREGYPGFVPTLNFGEKTPAQISAAASAGEKIDIPKFGRPTTLQALIEIARRQARDKGEADTYIGVVIGATPDALKPADVTRREGETSKAFRARFQNNPPAMDMLGRMKQVEEFVEKLMANGDPTRAIPPLARDFGAQINRIVALYNEPEKRLAEVDIDNPGQMREHSYPPGTLIVVINDHSVAMLPNQELPDSLEELATLMDFSFSRGLHLMTEEQARSIRQAHEPSFGKAKAIAVSSEPSGPQND